jgi:hypothetical protein
MARFELCLQGTKFDVPKRIIIDFFEHHPQLFNTDCYEVQSNVPIKVFTEFVEALETNPDLIPVITETNVQSLALLASEFFHDVLTVECERLLSQFRSVADSEIHGTSTDELIKTRLSALEHTVEALWAKCESIERRTPDSSSGIDTSSSSSESKSVKHVECPLQDPSSFDGIISFLTRRHGGNVHDKGIVTITSKSVDSDQYPLRNVADLTSYSYFCSKHEPDQWICWDFHALLVRLTHYAIRYYITSFALKSWVVEGSLDGESWTTIDEHVNHDHLPLVFTRWYGVSKTVECRFIRLTLTAPNHCGNNGLMLVGVEFFGTFLDRNE